MSWVVAIIIFLAVLLVLFPVVYKIQAASRKSAEKGICRISVEKLAAGKKIAIIGQELVGAKLDCPREQVIFKKNEAQDKMSEKLAKAIEQCAWNFGMGKSDFTHGGWLSQASHCAICAKIIFEDGAGFDPKSYSEWINRTHMIGTGITYAEYFKNLNNYEGENLVLSGIDPREIGDSNRQNHQEFYLYFWVMQYQTKAEEFMDQKYSWITGPFKAGWETMKKIDPKNEVSQLSSFFLTSTDDALKGCQNLLN